MKCAADPACVWPADETGRCKWHARDYQASMSDMGSTMAMAMDNPYGYGFRLHRGQTQTKNQTKAIHNDNRD